MCAAALTTWSMATMMKLTVIISATGRRPDLGAPCGGSRASQERPSARPLAGVDVAIEVFGVRVRTLLCELHRLLDLGGDLLVDLLDLLIVNHLLLLQVLAEAEDAVPHLPFLDLVLAPVGIRVGHRVPAVPVGHALEG